jgi:hexosaminidase
MGTRVVTDGQGPFMHEAARLARELGVRVGTGPAGRGDVELALDRNRRGPEAYSLVSRGGRVQITGATAAGIFYGTRTLLQMLRSRGAVPPGVVTDQPDRPVRGLNLDIARKYFTPAWIETRLHEMADLKLNELDLHLSDDEGLRVESSSHPEVVSNPHLTKAQIRHIVAVAAGLHITVVPEIDSPGHLRTLLQAHPELAVRDRNGNLASGAINIADPRSARIIDGLLREYAPLFPGPYWHLGADEYAPLSRPDPEASFPQLAAAARRKFGTKARIRDLECAWLNDRAATVRALGKRMRAWNDGILPAGVVTPAKDIGADYWTGTSPNARTPEDYLREGREVINVNNELLYYVLGPHSRYPTGQRIYESWTPAVLYGTRRLTSVPTGPDRVLGGRLAVWCDSPTVQTEEQVASGIRLPLRAIAQKLWDPRTPTLSWRAFTALADTLDRPLSPLRSS